MSVQTTRSAPDLNINERTPLLTPIHQPNRDESKTMEVIPNDMGSDEESIEGDTQPNESDSGSGFLLVGAGRNCAIQ